MDVETIQKINNLALDLMKQGLATDREDAVNQAEKIFRNREEYREIRQTMKETEPKSASQLSENTEDLPAQKVKEILQQNSTFMVKTIREFSEKIQVLEREVSDLRTKLTYQRLPTVKEVVAQKENSQQAERPKTEPNPRSGNYKEADVSIEKFFYMGKK